jgi:hypothetical protein
MLIVFYVSGHSGGSMQAVGGARITSSATMRVEEAFVRYHRQGVLRKEELLKIADKHGLHVVTFDNYSWFYQPIEYKRLKELGCIGGANLVTAQRLGYDCMLRLLAEGFRSRELQCVTP